MQIKEMFKKSITRDIQGVVIAGQGEKTILRQSWKSML